MRTFVAGVVLVAVLSFATVAEAKFPTFNPKTIVPGQSLGGISIGMTKAQAATTWGKFENCFAYKGLTTCAYFALSHIAGTTIRNPYATVYLKAGRVVAVELESAENTALDPKIAKVKTVKGIHVGSALATARSKYHIPSNGGGEAGLSRAIIKGPRNRCTIFYAPTAPYTKIEAIQVGICGAAGLV